MTPLNVAEERGHSIIVQYLVNQKAETGANDKKLKNTIEI